MSEQITAQTVAQKLLEFYGGDSKRWTKGAYCRDKHGRILDAETSPQAVRWCLDGGCFEIFKDRANAMEAICALRDAIGTAVPVFNDDHTFKEVTSKLQEIATAKGIV